MLLITHTACVMFARFTPGVSDVMFGGPASTKRSSSPLSSYTVNFTTEE